MLVAFRDEHGNFGIVTEDLSLAYDGTARPDVREFIDRLEREFTEDDESLEMEAFVQELMFELPEETPVIEVTRRG